jgi:uncharacterized membrane protein
VRFTIHASQPAEGSFAASLPLRERRLATRLEGFGDIVFGFAVSQCALQLPYAHGHVSLAQPVSLLLYFGTFGLLASLWLTYHRLMSGAFKPTGIDLFIAFTYLALVSLMPFAMYAITHIDEKTGYDSSREALAEYTVLYATMMTLASVLYIRNLRRGWWTLDDVDRKKTWASFVRGCVVFAVMAAAFVVDIAFGPVYCSLVFFAIFPAMAFARRRFGRVPSAEKLRVAPAQTLESQPDGKLAEPPGLQGSPRLEP